MIFEPDVVKGFQDFLPPESQKREAIKKVIEEKFKLYGFLPVETPTIEYDETMRSDTFVEDEAISDRFRLKDKGGRNLGLRYEFTFQLARIMRQNPNIKLPFRRYQIGKVFRDEPVSSNRFREFTQCDIDILGDSSIQADVECIACFNSILKELKIKSEIQVNNKKLLSYILESVKIDDKQGAMKELDKLSKIGEDQVKGNLRKYASTTEIITLFKLLEKPLDFFSKNIFDGAEELEELVDSLKNYGVKVKFNPFLARGLSYYTGNLFEIVIPEKNISIGGGGRYDKTIGKYMQKEIPAVGVSFGLERVSEFAEIEIEKTRAIVISIDQDKKSIELSEKLRKSKIPCITSFGKLGKALEYANACDIQYAIFVGQEEVKEKKFKLKDLKTGTESLLIEKSLISKLKKN